MSDDTTNDENESAGPESPDQTTDSGLRTLDYGLFSEQNAALTIMTSLLAQCVVGCRCYPAKSLVTYARSSDPNQGGAPAWAFSLIRAGLDVAGIAT